MIETVTSAVKLLKRSQSATLLGIDYGEKRMGIAVGNTITHTATPLTIITATNKLQAFAAIEQLINAWQPTTLVLGLPKHPDGNPHALTVKVERFARQLEGRFRLPVALTDERYSSVEAKALTGRDDDALSACIILQQYLDEHV